MSQKITGLQIAKGLKKAAYNLTQHKDLLNQLNIFPVADKDTGVNMAHSMEEAVKYLSDGQLESPKQLLEEVYFQLLEHGHGNSGTILTLFFEGFSFHLPQTATISGLEFAKAFKEGANTAYAAVTKPKDGTILTVATQCANAGLSVTEVTEDLSILFDRMTDEARCALLQTAYQNSALRERHVVDSGAFGFCLILDGFVESILPSMPKVDYPTFLLPDSNIVADEDFTDRYCTEAVLVLVDDANLEEMDSRLKTMGSHYLCASGKDLCKIHIHTEWPEEILNVLSHYGTLKSKKIDDMKKQSES